MRWRQAKRLIRLDGKETCRCGEKRDGHAPHCHGRGGRLRRWSAYHRIKPMQWGRWWESHPLPECGL